jgi:hypothetical protein
MAGLGLKSDEIAVTEALVRELKQSALLPISISTLCGASGD